MADKTWTAEDVRRWREKQGKNSSESTWTAEDVQRWREKNTGNTTAKTESFDSVKKDTTIPKLEDTKQPATQTRAADPKMSREERKQTRKESKEWLKDYIKKVRKGEISQEQAAKDLMNADSEYYKMQEAYNKSDPLSTFYLGLISGMPLFDLVAESAADKGNLSAELYVKNRDSAKEQNKGATIAGNLVGNAASYTALNPMITKIPGLNKATEKVAKGLSKLPVLSKVGAEPIKNILSDMAVDVGLDTIPMIAKDVQEEKSAGEIAKDTALNIGGNLAGNILGESAPAILKTIIDKRVNGAEKVAENSLEQAAESLKSSESKLENIVSDVEGNGKKLKREAAQSVPGNVSKSAQGNGRTSEDSLNDHIKIEVKKAINRTPLTNNPAEIVTLFEERAKIVKKYGDDKSKKALRQFKSAIKEFSADGKVTTYQKVLDAAKNLDSSLLNMSPVKSKLNKLKTDMKSLVDLYGDKDTEELFDKFKTEVDAFEIDGNPESINNIMELAYELDKSMKGKAYTSPDILGKRGGVKQKGFSHRYGQGVSVKTVLNESLDSINEILPTKNPLSLEKFLINSVESADVEDDIIKNVPTQGQAAVPELKNILKNYERAVLANGDDDAWEELDVFRTALNNFETTGSIDAFRRVLNSSNRLDANLNGLSQNTIPALEMPVQEEKAKSPIPFLKFERKGRQTTNGEIQIPEKSSSETPLVKIPELNRGEYIKRTATNTLAKSDVFRDNPEMMNVLQEEINSGRLVSKTVTEDESLRAAKEALTKNPDEEAARLLSEARWSESKDFDEGMMLAKTAGDAGDFDTVRRIISKAAEEGSDAATVLQAHAKYSRTFEGALMKAQSILNKQVDSWKVKNPKEALMAEKLSNELGEVKTRLEMNLQIFGKTIRDAEEEVIRDEVKKAVDRLNLGNKVTEGDIGKITTILRKEPSKEIKKAVESIMANKKYGISDETIQSVKDIFEEADQYGENSRKRVQLENKAFALLAEEIVAPTWQDKWDTWRYFAMLHKPTTHERNFISTAAMYMVSETKDALAVMLEETIERASKNGINRTKAFLNRTVPADKALLKAARADAEDAAYRALSGSKYNAKQGIEGASKAFRGKPGKAIQKLADKNSELLEAEDWFFLKRKYANTLARYLKSQNLDASVLTRTDDISKELAEKAREYAIKEAKKATFHEDNEFAEALSNFSRKMKESDKIANNVIHGMLEGVMPFKKTPVNIVKTAGRYSPAGIGNAIKKGFEGVASGKYTASEVINSLSEGLTGTGIMALGAFLAAKGLVRGKGSSDAGQAALENLQGEQEYALQIGDANYTIDWLAPAVLPLLVGVEIYNAFEDNGLEFADVINGLSSVADPIVETTMMKGISDVLSGIKYSEDPKAVLSNLATDVATGYVTQGIPTSLSGLSRAIDNTRRKPLAENRGVVGKLEKELINTKNKIPFLSKSSPEYRDPWGRTQQNFSGSDGVEGDVGKTLLNAAYQFLSPGYYSKDVKTPNDEYLQSLYKEDGVDKSIVPKLITRNYTENKTNKRLSGEEYSKAQKITGEKSYQLVETLSKNNAGLSVEQQAEIIPDLYSVSKQIALRDTVNKSVSQNYEKAVKVYDEHGADGLIEWYKMKSTADSNENGAINTAESTAYLDKTGMSVEEKVQFLALNRSLDIENGKGGTIYKKYGARVAYEYAKIKGMKGNGANGAMLKEDWENALRKSGLTESQQTFILETQYPKKKK